MSAFGDLTITQAAYSARQLLERATRIASFSRPAK